MNAKTTTALALALLAAAPAIGGEGKWTPTQLSELDPADLRAAGLEIPAERLWGAEGAGLLDAAIKIGGCSAGFVSAEGLLVTNHHCAFGILQNHSTPDHDLITEGFLAATRVEEIGGAGTRATVPFQVHDVGDRIAAAIPAGADDLARYRAIEAEEKALVAECERRPARRCQVAAYDGGVRWELVESLEYPDVRLVFAPPRSVGEFGGEIDNWSWPRHTGDFTLLRVYGAPDGSPAPVSDANVPLAPRHFFPLSTEGVAPGDALIVAGYPGRTFRALTAPEMAERVDLYFPQRAELYAAWIATLSEISDGSDAARIALASRIKSLANREKNARGQLAGISRGDLLDQRRAADREVLDWAAERGGEHAAAAGAYRDLEAMVATQRETWTRDYLLSETKSGPRSLELALTLVRWAEEKAKPDAEREPEYQERNRNRLRERLERDQRILWRPAEEALLVDLLARLRAAGAEELVARLAGGSGDEAIRARVAAVHEGTAVTTAAARAAMFEEDEATLRARRDPLLDFAFALDPMLRELETRRDRDAGTVFRLRPVWRRAVLAHAGRPVAPDANGTLRVSLARVAGYSPRDAVWMEPRTTVAGMAAKATGEEPFTAPAELLAARAGAPASRWADAELGDVPVCFLADADTTGGNSGSPVLDARGRLVGVNFDRVWENVANDFGYDPAIARSITVDARYLLWVLETLHPEGSLPLLRELGAR